MLTVLPVLAFLFISVLVVAGAMALSSPSAGTIEQRLFELAGRRGPIEALAAPRERKTPRALTVLARMAPKSPSEIGVLQQRLVAAGYRDKGTLPLFIGLRVGIAVTLFAAATTPLVIRPSLPLALALAGVGYVLPGMVLG